MKNNGEKERKMDKTLFVWADKNFEKHCGCENLQYGERTFNLRKLTFAVNLLLFWIVLTRHKCGERLIFLKVSVVTGDRKKIEAMGRKKWL